MSFVGNVSAFKNDIFFSSALAVLMRHCSLNSAAFKSFLKTSDSVVEKCGLSTQDPRTAQATQAKAKKSYHYEFL